MLDVSSLSVTIGKRTIVRDIDFTVADGRVCGLIGPNGAGKSTLVKAVAGILPASRGTVRIDGYAMDTTDRRALARQVSFLPQNTTPVPCSAFDAVLLGRKPHIHWRPTAGDMRMADDVMEELGLTHLRNACVTRVSGGEFQKILIARALVQGARVLILDEPINHLDIRNQLDIMALIARLTRDRGLTTIIVLHDLNLAVRHADSLLLMRDGASLFNGAADDLSHDDLSHAFEVNVAIRDIGTVRHVLY